jgi:hypothetical protein
MSSTIQGVPATAVFSGTPPGIPAALGVSTEHGDVVLLVDLAGQPFCSFTLTCSDALDLNLGIAALVVDERRRRGGER